MNKHSYIYLHGFASSPKSTKAQYFSDRLAELGISPSIPDLNQGDFTNLTLTRQLKQVGETIERVTTPVTLIGSSFGGLTAAWLSQSYHQIERLILLAPAFNFLSHLRSFVGESAMTQWQHEGYYQFYHYSEERSLPLNYQFILDLTKYPETQLERSLPTLIFHGNQDTVIPIESSREYRDNHQGVKLIELASDHYLTDVLPVIWEEIKIFIK